MDHSERTPLLWKGSNHPEFAASSTAALGSCSDNITPVLDTLGHNASEPSTSQMQSHIINKDVPNVSVRHDKLKESSDADSLPDTLSPGRLKYSSTSAEEAMNEENGAIKADILGEDEVDFAIIMRDPANCSSSTAEPEEYEVLTRVYWQRYWILLLFSIITWSQSLLSNTWRPILVSVEEVFPDWTSGVLPSKLMFDWGIITATVVVLPASCLFRTKGLRIGILTCTALIALGTSLRCITQNQTLFIMLSHCCAVLVGIAGAFSNVAVPMLPCVWFPHSQRTTATAMALVANQLGPASSKYLEPLLIPIPSPQVTVSELKEAIRNLLSLEATLALVLVLLVMVYFPAAPSMPSSITSSVHRLKFVDAVREIFRNGNVKLIVVTYAIVTGVCGWWTSVLPFTLHEIGLHQDDVTRIGIVASLTSVLTGLVAGVGTDLAYGRVRHSLIILLTITCGLFFWFALFCWKTILPLTWQVYVCVVGGISLTFASQPLFYEIAVENAFPSPEPVVVAVMLMSMNTVSAIFRFLLYSMSDDGYIWVTYCVLGSNAVCILPLLLITNSYKRSAVDRQTPQLFSRTQLI